MKFVSFLNSQNQERIGILVDEKIYDLERCASTLALQVPSQMGLFLKNFDQHVSTARKVQEAITSQSDIEPLAKKNLRMLAPVPHPTSCRDAYAFRQHVAAARKNRGAEMIAEFDQFPIFYYTNHNAILGEGDVRVEADHLRNLDFELEAAIVIGKGGFNIKSSEADHYIAGYMIMNDFSARYLQMEEMKLSLGPAKGKDFATAIGPWLVTVDELEPHRLSSPFGNKYDLKMTARHNGKLVSQGNLKDMDWTFAEIIERASYGVELFPGDVIGSGTVGTGCYMELNGTWAREAKEKGKEFTPVWLQDGDEIELEIAGLGVLKNRIIKQKPDYSILAKRKNL